MSYNGSGTFQINTSGQPVVTGTVISSTAFNSLTSDLATGLSTAITKDGQTTTTVQIPFAQGLRSTLVTDSSSISTGSAIVDGGLGVAKALYVGTTANIAGATTLSGGTANGVAYLNGSKAVTTGTALAFDGTNLSVVTTGAVKVPSGTTGERPTATTGMFRFNTTGSQFEGYNGSAWAGVGGASGGAGNPIVYENDITISVDYTITTNKNAMSAGPLTLNSGITVTVPSGSTWVVL
jgi:hypothetical protein